MQKILVIEDNLDVRENLAEILTLSNFQVITAENGKIGVQKALQESPDLIICDVMMPELDGFGVLHILSKKPKTADIPFIFLTAKADKMDFRKGMNLGADDYITKPFDDMELLDAIEVRLKKTQRIKKIFDGSISSLNTLIDEARGKKALEQLSEEREVRHFKKKEILYQEGNLPNKIFYIVKGKVKIYKINDYGKEYITELYSEGEFFGYHPLIAGTKYIDYAATMEESEICYIPKDDFTALLYGNRDFSAQFIKMLANEVEDKEAQLLSLAYNSIRKRVAEALVALDKRSLEGEDKISIQRDDLASMVGTAKESVIRTLTDFKTEDLISIENGLITILALQKLKDMPN